MKIIFDKSLSPHILKAFNKVADKDGYIIDETTKERVISKSDREEIKLDEFAVITQGSEVYLKSDIVSLIKYVEGKLESK